MTATVEQVTAAYDNILVPLLRPGEERCTVCKSVVHSGYTCCYQCRIHRSALSCRADVVAPVALSFKGGQWAHELSAYKNSANPDARRTMAVKLGAVLWRWLELHEAHVAEAAGVSQFLIITSVPSTSGRMDHPLPAILKKIVGPTSNRYYDLLAVNPQYPAGSRDPRNDRFIAEGLQGQPVLLVDDQWTSGARAQSAAAALRLAGSGPVAVVPLGRHFDPKPDGDMYREAAQKYFRAAIKQGWEDYAKLGS